MINGEDRKVLVGGPVANELSGQEPFPIYRRGLYFDGIDDYMRAVDLVVPLSHTVEMWIFCMGNPAGLPDNQDLSYTFFSINF
jgi:hypothetical protein